MFSLLLSNPLAAVLVIAAFAISLSFHEFMHGWAAHQFGDDTPRLMGRLTLNPLAHLDLIGTLAMLFIGFGWAKPVPINPNNFRNPATNEIFVALAGPFANFLIALVFGLTARLLPNSILYTYFYLIAQLNLTLMIFNLIPVPPLDGSRLLQIVLPNDVYYQIEQYGSYFLIALIFFGSGIITQIISLTVTPLLHIIIG